MKNMKIIRWVLLALALLAIGAVVLTAMGTKKKQIVIKADMPKEIVKSGPKVELKNVAYSTTNNDNFKEWDLEADAAHYLQDQKRVVLDNVSVIVYRPNGKIYRIQGRNGEFNTETRDIKMRGSVWGAMPDNTTIQTESIDYDHKKRLITTDDVIHIRRDHKFALQGKGMVIDLNAEKMSLLSNVKALGSK